MIEVLILALALSMDAFAVSIGLGSKKNVPGLALRAGAYFGTFQAFMPFVGYLGGRGVLGWVEQYSHWIAAGLLFVIGAKMIYEGIRGEDEAEEIASVTHRTMFFLAIATSIDAMAAGFSLTLLEINPFLACLIIGITTFGFSFAGVHIGKKTGTWLESKSEIFGGVILLLMGIRFLVA